MANIAYLILFISFTFILGISSFSVRDLFRKNRNRSGSAVVHVEGSLTCPSNSKFDVKVVLKTSRNGKEIASQTHYSSFTGPSLLHALCNEPKFVFLQLIPLNGGKACGKTIQGKIRMREFLTNGDIKGHVFDVGDCDFSKGSCTKFESRTPPQQIYIEGSIVCSGSSKSITAKVVLKKRRRGNNEINSQSHESTNNQISNRILLQADSKEPNTVFLQILPVNMKKECGKKIESKLGMREFKSIGGRNVYSLGQCDLSTGKCTNFPFPEYN